MMNKQEVLHRLELCMKNSYCDIHAIYDPDKASPFPNCYYAAVDLFKPGLTFRVYFKENEEGIKVEYAERWHFG